jgi:hypothetical protein
MKTYGEVEVYIKVFFTSAEDRVVSFTTGEDLTVPIR